MLTILRIGTLMLLAGGSLAAESPAIIGEAFSLKTHQLVYRELHYINPSGLDHRVEYRTPDNKVLAVKTIDYRSGLNAPRFRQISRNSGELIEVDWREGKLLMQYRQDARSKLIESLMNPPEKLVVDAGFNHFIQQHWAALNEGSALVFNFAAPARQSLVDLVIQRKDCGEWVAMEQRGSSLCLLIHSPNWLLRLLMEPIELAYDSHSQHLMQYRGLANVSDDNGDSYRVNIRYQYPFPAGTRLAAGEFR